MVSGRRDVAGVAQGHFWKFEFGRAFFRIYNSFRVLFLHLLKQIILAGVKPSFKRAEIFFPPPPLFFFFFWLYFTKIQITHLNLINCHFDPIRLLRALVSKSIIYFTNLFYNIPNISIIIFIIYNLIK